MSALKNHKSDSDLINKAQGAARSLTYNDDKPQAVSKHLLLELCHRLGSKCTGVVKRKGRLSVTTLFGQTREMTFRERIMYRCFKVIPSI
jgi:hypothetical protein